MLEGSSNWDVETALRKLRTCGGFDLFNWIGKYYHSGKGSQSQADDEQVL